MFFNNDFIKKIIPEVIVSGLVSKIPEVAVDSRICKKGDIFFALKGKEKNGHDFALEAIANGADVVVIDQEHSHLEKSFTAAEVVVIIVPDTYLALVSLAKAWRQQFDIKFVGITGSVGKTTTKEILASICRLNKFNCLVSSGNYNTEVGLAITLFKLRLEHQLAILEMGISQRGEMAKLVDLVNPDIAAITALAHSHVAGLGSITDISIEKRTIFSNFKPDNIGIVNGDHPLLGSTGYTHPVVRFGSKTTNQIQARKVRVDSYGAKFLIKLYKNKYDIFIKHGNLATINNAIAAASVAKVLGIPDKIIIEALNTEFEIKGRFQFKEIPKGLLIDDCYNANPESMKNALLAFEAIKTSDRKIAILGDMNELGIDSPYWHRQVGRVLRKTSSIDKIFLVGNMIKHAQETMPLSQEFVCLEKWQDVLRELEKEDKSVLLLIKGSTYGYTRGLAELVNYLTVKPVSKSGVRAQI